MSVKTHELILLSYINKFNKIDYIDMQKEINAPILQLSNIIYDLYNRGYFILTDQEGGAKVTEKAKAEPIHVWNAWTKEEELGFDGTQEYEGERNEFLVPKIEDEKKLMEILKLDHIKERSYHIFEIYNGEKKRMISAPSRELKERQKWILNNILYKLKNKDCVHGFVRGRSIVTNASCHVGKKEILCIDIADFFPSIKLDQVKEIFIKIGYTNQVARRLGELCTFIPIMSEVEELPQGAPTSPALANIVFDAVDSRLLEYAHENQLVYTRYADDLTFSTDTANIEKHLDNLIHFITESGFQINKDKTHIMKDNYRKMVTGLIVNEKVKVPKKFKRRFKQELYYCQKYGISQHLQAIGRSNAINFQEYMYGKAYFIKMVEAGLGEYYLRQLDELFSNSNI